MTVERHLGQFLKNSGCLPGCEPTQSHRVPQKLSDILLTRGNGDIVSFMLETRRRNQDGLVVGGVHQEIMYSMLGN